MIDDDEVDATRRRLEQRARDMRDSTNAAGARPGKPTPRDSIVGIMWRPMKVSEIWNYTRIPLVLIGKTLESLEAEGVVRRVKPSGESETFYEKVIPE